MKNTYIARQAILNNKFETIGYELFFRDSPENKFPDIEQDIASSKLIVQNHILGDIETLCMGKAAFINFTEHCLIHKFPLMFNKNAIVIELVGYAKPTNKLMKIMKYYYGLGYSIALSEYDLAEHWDAIFPYIDIVKVNIEEVNTKRLLPVVKRMQAHNIKLTAERVETRNQQQTLAEVGFHYYQGYFYHQPEMVKGRKLTSSKIKMLELISETFNTPLNFDKVAKIISYDVNLTVCLLKMVNNVTTGTKIEITSLKQAASYLGEEKLRQFVSVLALSNLTSDSADELCKQALITGKMMSELCSDKNFKSVKEFAFITGLLSAVEAILETPITEVVKTMPLAEPIENALVKQEGLLGKLLTLTKTYIVGAANNGDVSTLISEHELNKHTIQKEFVNASQWCHSLGI